MGEQKNQSDELGATWGQELSPLTRVVSLQLQITRITRHGRVVKAALCIPQAGLKLEVYIAWHGREVGASLWLRQRGCFVVCCERPIAQ